MSAPTAVLPPVHFYRAEAAIRADQRRRYALDVLRARSSRVAVLGGGRPRLPSGERSFPCTTDPSAQAARSYDCPVLTFREAEVLRAWILSDTKSDVARELHISVGTVNTHLNRIRAKYAALGRSAGTKAALVARSIQDGIVDIDEL